MYQRLAMAENPFALSSADTEHERDKMRMT